MDEPCPRCNSQDFAEKECGSDSYDDDITWTSYKCLQCELWYSGWRDKWLVDVDSWHEEEGAEEYACT